MCWLRHLMPQQCSLGVESFPLHWPNSPYLCHCIPPFFGSMNWACGVLSVSTDSTTLGCSETVHLQQWNIFFAQNPMVGLKNAEAWFFWLHSPLMLCSKSMKFVTTQQSCGAFSLDASNAGCFSPLQWPVTFCHLWVICFMSGQMRHDCHPCPINEKMKWSRQSSMWVKNETETFHCQLVQHRRPPPWVWQP